MVVERLDKLCLPNIEGRLKRERAWCVAPWTMWRDSRSKMLGIEQLFSSFNTVKLRTNEEQHGTASHDWSSLNGNGLGIENSIPLFNIRILVINDNQHVVEARDWLSSNVFLVINQCGSFTLKNCHLRKWNGRIFCWGCLPDAAADGSFFTVAEDSKSTVVLSFQMSQSNQLLI